MKNFRKTVQRFACLILSAILAFSGLETFSTEAQAAVKPKKITVKASNKLLGAKKTIYVGGPKAYKTTKLIVTVTPKKASKKVKYVSSKPKVATVNSKGVVTAKKAGKTTITVTSKAKKSVKRSIKITVKKYVYPKKLTLTAAKSLNGGETLTIKTAFTPSNTSDKKVTYKSSNKNLATVNANGVVTANKNNKAGTVKITVTARAKNAKKKTVKKTVQIAIKKQIEASKITLSTQRIMYLNGVEPTATTTLNAIVTPDNVYNKTVTWTSSNPEVATVSSGKVVAKKIGVAIITAKTSNGKTATCKITVKRRTVSVHDPSVVKGDDGNYYIYGSHMAWAQTSNLEGWKTFTNNINANSTDTGSIFADYWNNWAKYNSSGVANQDNSGNAIALSGNQWAPDVIYNKDLKKWTLYMSVNGPDYNSVIVMCTSDSPTGDWTVAGPVVYSGFTNKAGVSGHNVSYTDYTKVTGDAQVDARYLSNGSWNRYYGTNAIDPSVKYDENGDLWMVYGSWYGGIYAIKLGKDGLRDYSYTYEYDTDTSDGTTSDPYMGIRVAGGNRVSGEGAYIIKSGDYWYMFLSYGGLVATGNYNMRVFRSENVDGPYVDAAGNSALNTSTNPAGNQIGNIGIRLMAGYQWPCNTKAYLAQGHNSALVDDDGKMYLVFHTRTNDGTEGHYVKTHQMFMNEDGWLCVAPYEYTGEEMLATGYAESEYIGAYDFIIQKPETGGGKYITPEKVTLNSDGTLGGAVFGTWSVKDNSPYITMEIQSGNYKGTYKGVLCEMADESDEKVQKMTFSIVGDNNVCIWGSKIAALSDSIAANTTATTLNGHIPAISNNDMYLPTVGAEGATITWTSSNTDVITADGKVTRPYFENATTTLTAVISKGTASVTRTYTIATEAEIAVNTFVVSDAIELQAQTSKGEVITWASSDESIIATDGTVILPEEGSVKVTLTATVAGQSYDYEVMVSVIDNLTEIYTQDYENTTLADAGWTTHGALSSAIGTEGDNSYAGFTSTGSGPRSGMQNLGIDAANLTSSYVVSTDFRTTVAAYSGSGTPTTQIALIAQENGTSATSNALASGGCIVDLQAYGHGQQTFTINGNSNETVDIPSGEWCNMKVIIDKIAKQAYIVITNKATGEELYSGTVEFTGEGNVKGFYILNGRGGTNVQFDNTTVGVTGNI